MARRSELRRIGTDALRLIDGSGDGVPDVELEDYAGRWLVQTKASKFPMSLFRGIIPISTSSSQDAVPAIPGQISPRAIYWKRLGDKESPRHIAGEVCAEPFVVTENHLKYWIDFTAGCSQGIFLDQRENRREVQTLASKHDGFELLNCFAYTCAFGVCAAAGGAHTTNLDLSKRYLEWGKRNYELNGLDPSGHEFIYGDAMDWMKRFAKRGRKFDAVVLDPPTFSRNEKGVVFRVEDHLHELVLLAEIILKPHGFLFVSTNQRSLTPASFRALVLRGLSHPGAWHFHQGQMPPDFTGEQYLKSCFVSR